MKKNQRSQHGGLRRVLPAAAALAIGSAAMAPAGIPAPDMVVYGQVRNGSALVTSGKLTWTYTPSSGAAAIEVSAKLAEIPGPGGESFSYIVQVPIEQAVSGESPRLGSLSLTANPLQLHRTARLGDQELIFGASQFGQSFTVNLIDFAGLAERVDLELYDPNSCCPGDADRDGFVNILDYRSVRDNFGNPNPAMGDASCDSFVNMADYLSVRDNLGTTCPPPAPRMQERAYPDAGSGGLQFHVAMERRQYQVGDVVELQVGLDPAGNQPMLLAAFLEFDAGAMEYAGGSIDRGIMNAGEFTSDPRPAAPGRVVVSGGRHGAMKDGTPALAVVRLRLTAPGEHAISLVGAGPFAASALDVNFEPIPTSVATPVLTLQVGGGEVSGIDDWVIF